MEGAHYGPIFLALVIGGVILGIVAARGAATATIAVLLVRYGMIGLLVDQHMAWGRIQRELPKLQEPKKSIDGFSEGLFAEYLLRRDALHWVPRRDLSLPAEPHEGS